MEVLLFILLLAIQSATNIVGFVLGAKIGQKVSKGELIEVPTLNPMKAVRERWDRKQAEAEQERIDAIMRNIESYDGTSRGQTDVPRG